MNFWHNLSGEVKSFIYVRIFRIFILLSLAILSICTLSFDNNIPQNSKYALYICVIYEFISIILVLSYIIYNVYKNAVIVENLDYRLSFFGFIISISGMAFYTTLYFSTDLAVYNQEISTLLLGTVVTYLSINSLIFGYLITLLGIYCYNKIKEVLKARREKEFIKQTVTRQEITN